MHEQEWITDKTLAELRLRDEGLLVLGIVRANGDYVGSPGGDTEVVAGDTLIIYGREAGLRDIDDRLAGVPGDVAHQQAVSERQKVAEQEDQEGRGSRQATEERQRTAQESSLEGSDSESEASSVALPEVSSGASSEAATSSATSAEKISTEEKTSAEKLSDATSSETSSEQALERSSDKADVDRPDVDRPDVDRPDREG